jgi:hypothetical protein
MKEIKLLRREWREELDRETEMKEICALFKNTKMERQQN